MDLICIVSGLRGEIHHIYTRKAHPDLKDTPWNMIPVSRAIHMEWHNSGTDKMAKKYHQIRIWLRDNGWARDPVLMKWEHAGKYKKLTE